MAGEIFRQALTLNNLADLDTGRGGAALIGNSFEEFAHPDPAGIAGGAAGGEDMVGADSLVAIGHGGLLAEEERAIITQMVKIILLVVSLGQHLQMLRRPVVTEGNRFVAALGDADLPIMSPGRLGDIARAQAGELPRDLISALLRISLVKADQQQSGIEIMLGLAKDVGSHDGGVDAAVGDDGDL